MVTDIARVRGSRFQQPTLESSGVRFTAPYVMFYQCLVLLLSCARPGAEYVVPQTTGLIAVLNALPLDSLCAGNCKAIKIDTAIRRSPALLMHYPLRDSIVAFVTTKELSAVALHGMALLSASSWYDPTPVPDTLRVAAYLVESGPPDSMSREFGIVVFPPNQPLQTWRVRAVWNEQAWKVVEVALHYVP